jgi:hypothetical protein
MNNELFTTHPASNTSTSTVNTAKSDIICCLGNEDSAVICGGTEAVEASSNSSAASIFVKDYEGVDTGFYTRLRPPPFSKTPNLPFDVPLP